MPHTPSAWTFWLSVALALLAVEAGDDFRIWLSIRAGLALWATLFLWLAALSRRSEVVSRGDRIRAKWTGVFVHHVLALPDRAT